MRIGSFYTSETFFRLQIIKKWSDNLDVNIFDSTDYKHHHISAECIKYIFIILGLRSLSFGFMEIICPWMSLGPPKLKSVAKLLLRTDRVYQWSLLWVKLTWITKCTVTARVKDKPHHCWRAPWASCKPIGEENREDMRGENKS